MSDHQAQTKRYWFSRRMLIIICLTLALFLPVKVNCGAPRYNNECATGPDQKGLYSLRYDKEPWLVFLIEDLFNSDINISYSSGFNNLPADAIWFR